MISINDLVLEQLQTQIQEGCNLEICEIDGGIEDNDWFSLYGLLLPELGVGLLYQLSILHSLSDETFTFMLYAPDENHRFKQDAIFVTEGRYPDIQSAIDRLCHALREHFD